MAEQVDVLICGSGSAGVCAATWLARYGVRCKILDKRLGPMKIGQADGVQCRTVEVFDSFGIAEELIRESYHVLELSFWGVDGEGGIKRTSQTADTTPGLSHQPHVILNQARINGLMIEAMYRFNEQTVDYGLEVRDVQFTSDEEYPVRVLAEQDGKEVLFQARYVLGCDGAHSNIRRSLGYKMIGDSTNSVYGVMDVYPQTNFPDIRKKVAIKSESGTLMIIPREGGSLVRFYIELGHDVASKDVKLEHLHEAAKKIFHPYTMNIVETSWWSAYSIGQRLCDHFSKDGRVFLTGDACHTHSPKAGQGMNCSLQDGYNLGWKLASVLKGTVKPDILDTYTSERQMTAKTLIDFDRTWAKMFAKEANVSSEYIAEQFKKAGQYTAGLATAYKDSAIISAERSTQSLARNLVVGMRMPSTQVVRWCDTNTLHLVKALPADGRWRIIAFPGDVRKADATERLENLATYLASASGPIRTYTRSDADIDSFIEPIVVLSGPRVEVEQDQIPEFFFPKTGKYGVRDMHKVHFDDQAYDLTHGYAYEFYGVDPEVGAIVVLRPDQYVSMVVGFDEIGKLGAFFAGFAVAQDTQHATNGKH